MRVADAMSDLKELGFTVSVFGEFFLILLMEPTFSMLSEKGDFHHFSLKNFFAEIKEIPTLLAEGVRINKSKCNLCGGTLF